MTLDSTASMNARRVSSCVLAVRKAVVCSSSRPVIRLKAAASVCTSSSLLRDWNPNGEVARFDAASGGHQLTNGPDKAVGQPKRRQDGQADDDQRAEQKRGVEFELVQAGSRQ